MYNYYNCGEMYLTFTAQESMVLLKNDGILPLNVSAIKSVALIGPCADEPECNTGRYIR